MALSPSSVSWLCTAGTTARSGGAQRLAPGGVEAPLARDALHACDAGAGGVRGRPLPATRPCTSLPVLDVSLAHHTKTRITMQCRDGIACLIRYMGRVADLDVSIETLWFTATYSHLHPYLDHDRLLLALTHHS